MLLKYTISKCCVQANVGFLSASIPNMCSLFSERHTQITQLSMSFNTEGLDAARECACSVSLGNRCQGPAGSSNVDGCPFGREVHWRSAIFDNSIISCGRGNIQQDLQDRHQDHLTSLQLDGNQSNSIVSAAGVIWHTVRQYGAYADAHMAGTIVLSGNSLVCLICKKNERLVTRTRVNPMNFTLSWFSSSYSS